MFSCNRPSVASLSLKLMFVTSFMSDSGRTYIISFVALESNYSVVNVFLYIEKNKNKLCLNQPAPFGRMAGIFYVLPR